MGKDPTVDKHIMEGVEKQAKEYQTLSNQMRKILEGRTKKITINHHQPYLRQIKSPKYWVGGELEDTF